MEIIECIEDSSDELIMNIPQIKYKFTKEDKLNISTAINNQATFITSKQSNLYIYR